MPGCLSYVVAHDTTEPDAIWITEVWDSEASHKGSLSLPAVQAVDRQGATADRGLQQSRRDQPGRRRGASVTPNA